MIIRAYDDFLANQSPDIFATFTFGNDFFRRKEGGRMRTIERSSRESAVKECTLSFLRMLSRKTKQHVRMFYGAEDTLSEVESRDGPRHYPGKRTGEKRTHIHGLILFESSMYRVLDYAKDIYSVESSQDSIEDALSLLWSKHLAFNYCSWVRENPNQFKIYRNNDGGAGSYSCLKHNQGELLMDACPRCKHICRKGKGDCAFHWSNKSYE